MPMFYYRMHNCAVCSRKPLSSMTEIDESEAMQAETLAYVSNRAGEGKTI